MHSKAMWPIHGHYICPDCHREYPVAWEAMPPDVEYRRPVEYRRQPQRSTEPVALKASWSAKVLFQRAAGGLKRSDTM
jgi:hypothetical protein